MGETSSAPNSLRPCEYCGLIHSFGGVCPRVKAFEYHPNGSLKRVEFHAPEPTNWPLSQTIKLSPIATTSGGANHMTNSPIPGAISEKRLTEIETASATVRKPVPGNPQTGVTRGYVYLEPDETLALVSAYRRIETLQRELAEAKANVDAATEVQNDATRALLAAESQALSARRLALEEAAQIAHGAFLKWAKGPKMLAGAALGASDIEKAILALIDPPAAIRDIKGET